MLERLFWNHDARKRLTRLARKRPWDQLCPLPAEAAYRLKGMLGQRESLLFYHLARAFYTGRGAVVDAGSFLGKSASLFAAGLSKNPVVSRTSRKVHCFDNFRVNEWGTVGFIQQHFGCDVSIGQSTRELFDGQTATFRETLEVHAGDFHQACWTAGPIEILMVDIAKSQSLWARLVAEMFPSLVPGESVVIHQDYYHTTEPPILVGMEFLRPYFELVIPRVDDSAVFFYREAIPPAVIARLASDDFAPQDRRSLLDAAIARLAPEDQINALLARIRLGMRTGEDPEKLLREFQGMEKLLPQSAITDLSRPGGLQPELVVTHAWKLLRSGKWTSVLEILDELGNRWNEEDCLFLRGCALNGLARYREAEESLRKIRPNEANWNEYVPLELARAVLHQRRHDEAEQILLDSLSRPAAPSYDRQCLALHITLLRDVFAAPGDGEKARSAIKILKGLFPDDPALHLMQD